MSLNPSSRGLIKRTVFDRGSDYADETQKEVDEYIAQSRGSVLLVTLVEDCCHTVYEGTEQDLQKLASEMFAEGEVTDNVAVEFFKNGKKANLSITFSIWGNKLKTKELDDLDLKPISRLPQFGKPLMLPRPQHLFKKKLTKSPYIVWEEIDLKTLDIQLGLSCKNSQEFMNLCAVHFMHDLNVNNSDIKLLYNSQTHTAFLEIHVLYFRGRFLLKDKHINGTMKLTLDNGWDWIRIELQELSEKDIEMFLFSLNHFIQQVKTTYPDLFGEFNPSERA